jgi:hypothetical protein
VSEELGPFSPSQPSCSSIDPSVEASATELIGASILNILDSNIERIESERAGAKRGLEAQGERMIDQLPKE